MEGADPILPLLVQDVGHVFAVVDGAQVQGLQSILRRFSLDPRPLYFDQKGGSPHAAGPHLIASPDQTAILQLRDALPHSAVVWWIWPGPDAKYAGSMIYRHLRGLGMVEIPFGYPDQQPGTTRMETVLFRHADPGVLAQVLPVLDDAQRARLYGKALAIVIDCARAGGLRIARVPDGLPMPPAGFLRLTAVQMDAITDRRVAIRQRQVTAFLRRTMPTEYQGASAEQLAELVQISDATGSQLGLKSTQAFCRWAYLMLLSRGQAAELPEVRAALLSASQPDARVKTLLAEAAEALREGGAA